MILPPSPPPSMAPTKILSLTAASVQAQYYQTMKVEIVEAMKQTTITATGGGGGGVTLAKDKKKRGGKIQGQFRGQTTTGPSLLQ